MRRAQSLRNYAARPSLALAADDLGMLREGDETDEDILRKQLLEKDRECDKLRMTIQALQDQLSQRPPVEAIHQLQKDYKDLDLLLQGTQRENEKCMVDLEREKARTKMLERELTRLAGENWQANLEIPSSSNISIRSSSGVNSGLNMMHHRSNTISSPIAHGLGRSYSPSYSPRPGSASGSNYPPLKPGSPTPQRKASSSSYKHPDHTPRQQQQESDNEEEQKEAQRQAALAQMEQIRILILGMDKKLDLRQEKLEKIMDRAEAEGKKYESKVLEAQSAGVGLKVAAS